MMRFDKDGQPLNIPGPGKDRIVHHGYPGLTKKQAGCFALLFGAVILLAVFAVVTSDDNPYPDQSSPPSLTIEDYITADAITDATARAEIESLIEGVDALLATVTATPEPTPYPYDARYPWCADIDAYYAQLNPTEPCNLGTPFPTPEPPPTPNVTYSTPRVDEPLTEASPSATVVTTDRNSHD